MKFKQIYIEITNRCNLSCDFCSAQKRRADTMCAERFERVLAQIKPYTDYVYLHVKGEPLLHPDLPLFLELCKQYNLYVHITTNGTLLSQVGSSLFIEKSVRQINISLHSVGQHKTDLKRYMENIVCFAKAVSSEGIYLVLRLWNLGLEGCLDDETLGVLQYISDGFQVELSTEHLLEKRSQSIGSHVFLSFDKQFEWPKLENDFVSDKGKCYGAKRMLGILVDGTVVPCCLDCDGVIELGNVFTQDLKEILGTKRYIEMVAGFQKQLAVEPLCKHCGYRTRFS